MIFEQLRYLYFFFLNFYYKFYPIKTYNTYEYLNDDEFTQFLKDTEKLELTRKEFKHGKYTR